MRAILKVTAALVLSAAVSEVASRTTGDEGDIAFKAGNYWRAYRSWYPAAATGDSEQRERIISLLRGPHARASKFLWRQRYEGTRFLYRAAVGGERSAMTRLAEDLRAGAHEVKKLPDAAECWAKTPAEFHERMHCVALTEFRDRRARASCSELVLSPGADGVNLRDGSAAAKLCLANKTPALLVPGLPPSATDMRRVREYAAHGIELAITGDVYEEPFERFRETFNSTMADAVDAKNGRGYLERLGKSIEGKITRRQ